MITIRSSPEVYGATMGPLYSQDGFNLSFLLDSTNKAMCSMKYVTDVYINGGATAITRIKLSPNGINGQCSVTLNRVLADYISFDSFPGLLGATNCPNSIISYSTAFGEETDGTFGCSGASFSVDPDLAFGSTGTAINACIQYLSDYAWYDYYVSNGSTSGQFLTNGPTAQDIYIDEESYLYFAGKFTPGGTAPALRVTRIQDSGAANEFWVLNGAVNGDVQVIAYGVGPENLNEAGAAGLVLDECGQIIGTTASAYPAEFITCATDHYDVCIADVPTLWPC